MPRRPSQPAYRLHKSSGQAVVTLGGKDVYLGKHDTPESRAEYDRRIAEWLANGRRLPATATDITVNEVVAAFLRHAEQHYRRPDGTVTDEWVGCKLALRPLVHLYGHQPAAGIGPLALKAVRELMVAGYVHPRHGEQGPLARGVVNQRIGKIKRAFKWAAPEELIPVATWQALTTVAELQRGRTPARETDPVGPVAVEHVEATLPHLLPCLRAMVQVQLYSGMRPGEVCAMRTCDVDMAGAVWLYKPPGHKNAHRGKGRVVALGPRAQAALRPWLRPELEAPLFSPREAVEAQRGERAARRRTPASCGNRPGSNRVKEPRRRPGDRYTTKAYYHAVLRAAEKADALAREQAIEGGMDATEAARVFVPPWHVNQLRHTAATLVRREYGLEASQVVLGHAKANTTEVYAERDLRLAVEVAGRIG